jgi:hypothetical protein
VRFWLAGPRILGMRLGISFRPDELLRKPSPRRQSQGSFIYIIRSDHGLIKIGISSNPNARLAQLSTASAIPLKLAYVGALRGSGYAIEAEAHRTLAAYRRSGEWFNCPTDMAVAAIGAAAYRLGEPIASIDTRLAGEVARLAINNTTVPTPDIFGSVVLGIIKGIIGVVLAIVIWCSLWLAWCLITCV